MSKQALTLALEHIEGNYTVSAEDAITAIKEALAQPEQEPVEWGVDWGPDGNSVSIIKRLADGNIEVLAWEYAPHPPQRTEQEQEIETLKRCLFQMQEAAKDLVEQAKSLTPPQRTWVGLTDEDMTSIITTMCNTDDGTCDTRSMCRAIEAKLKEKNT